MVRVVEKQGHDLTALQARAQVKLATANHGGLVLARRVNIEVAEDEPKNVGKTNPRVCFDDTGDVGRKIGGDLMQQGCFSDAGLARDHDQPFSGFNAVADRGERFLDTQVTIKKTARREAAGRR